MNSNKSSPERGSSMRKPCIFSVCKGQRFDLVHKFPMNKERAIQWLRIIDVPGLEDIPLDTLRKRYFICSRHFRKEDYKNCESRSLNTTAYPRLFLKTNENADREPAAEIQTYEIAEELIQTPELTAIEEVIIPTKLPSTTTYRIHSIEQKKPQQIQQPPKLVRTLAIQRIDSFSDKIVTSSSPIVQPVKAYVRLTNKKNENNKRVLQTSGDKSEPVEKKRVADPLPIDLDPLHDVANSNERTLPEADKLLVFNCNNLTVRVNSVWLRERCPCSECCDEHGQRQFSFLDVPLNIEPVQINIEASKIKITWPDQHQSAYDINKINEDLQQNSNNDTTIKRQLWTHENVTSSAYARVTLNDYLCNDDVAGKVVESVVRFGCAFITNVPANQQSTEIAIKRLFPIQRSHLGELWSLSDNKSHRDTTYTNDELHPHNELIYSNDMPGLHILHCISQAGSNISLVDGFQALDQVKAKCPKSYEYLCNTPITAEYITEGHHFKHVAPIIDHNPATNEPIQIRFNVSDQNITKSLSQNQLLGFYQHYREVATEMLAKEKWTFKLEPGTVCILDNWRVLNGHRLCTGRRQVVGCFVSRSDFMSVARQMKYVS